MPLIVADTVQSTVDSLLAGIGFMVRQVTRWFRR